MKANNVPIEVNSLKTSIGSNDDIIAQAIPEISVGIYGVEYIGCSLANIL